MGGEGVEADAAGVFRIVIGSEIRHGRGEPANEWRKWGDLRRMKWGETET